eukprot:3484431-Rhodomonas_salina.1
MASQLTFADGSFSPVSTCFPDKYNSSRYQREVVNRAIKAGCDSLQCPVRPTRTTTRTTTTGSRAELQAFQPSWTRNAR